MADKIVRVEKDNNLYWGVLEDDTVTVIDGDLYTGYNKTEIEFALSDVTLKAPVQPSTNNLCRVELCQACHPFSIGHRGS